MYVYIYIYRYIKLTSPVINMAMCAGAVLLYLDVIILGIPTSDITVKTGLCNVGFNMMINTITHTHICV